MTKGYKATHNYKCRNQTYEVGQEYKLDEIPKICQYGFHYCVNAKHTLDYYDYDKNFKLLEIEDLSNDTIIQDDKSCSNHIKIIREITDPEELMQLLGFVCTFNKFGRELTCKNLDGYWCEYTYNENGDELTYKNSYGYSREYTYNSKGQILTCKCSTGFWSEYTYDEKGRINF